MSIDRETLMAFADGELDEATRRRVEQAIADDPELARQIEAERKLRAQLQAHFAKVVEEPLPEAWKAMIAAERARELRPDDGVASLDAARARRSARSNMPRWANGLGAKGWGATGMAIAASLALGVALGTQLRQEGGPVVARDGSLVASAGLARALDTQLASAKGGGEPRMVATFARATGEYCRVFSGQALSGIACRESGRWKLERIVSAGARAAGEYRQAGSAEAELMAAAQEMAAGEPLDSAGEAAARDRGWRR